MQETIINYTKTMLDIVGGSSYIYIYTAFRQLALLLSQRGGSYNGNEVTSLCD